ncbi:hypothetical protein ANCDUO_06862, partial [Ancylostoma duodenale]
MLVARRNVVSTDASSDIVDEKELWARYWSLEAAGTEEFTESEKNVQSVIDKRVWDDFRQTVERRDDGYYVRLPWKELTTPLPDNKVIAYRRLVSVWNSLQKDENLLEQYNGVFQEQLHQNIVEEVDDEGKTLGDHIHYIPHQAVLTPHKTTTELRIVFDASAHYRDCPSLNDALHRGP